MRFGLMRWVHILFLLEVPHRCHTAQRPAGTGNHTALLVFRRSLAGGSMCSALAIAVGSAINRLLLASDGDSVRHFGDLPSGVRCMDIGDLITGI
jgi:hypothetical protein